MPERRTLVGAALAGDGPQSGPTISKLLHKLPGPLRGPSPASAARTSTAHGWKRVIILQATQQGTEPLSASMASTSSS